VVGIDLATAPDAGTRRTIERVASLAAAPV